jgi:hypothetical protein
MKIAALVLVILILVVAGYLIVGKGGLSTLPTPNNTTSSQPPSNLPKEVEVPLNTQNNSNELGVATLQKVNGKLVVKINLKGQTDNTPQPAHIHLGSCPNVGVVKYPLNPVVNGSSETILDTTGDDLPKLLPLSINVHKSDSQMQTYVACGDIKL